MKKQTNSFTGEVESTTCDKCSFYANYDFQGEHECEQAERFFALNKLSPYSKTYSCDEDCQQQGCLGHVAKFEYHHVTDTYTINLGDGQKIHLDNSQFSLILDFARKLTK